MARSPTPKSRSGSAGSSTPRARDRRAHRPPQDRGGALDRRRRDPRARRGGLCGLYVAEEYGGQGLSQTGYARVFETFAQIDATLSIVLGVHQSIGFKGIYMFGTDEQKERFLPDLATGRKLAGFALTEPEAGLGRVRHRVARGRSSRTAPGC